MANSQRKQYKSPWDWVNIILIIALVGSIVLTVFEWYTRPTESSIELVQEMQVKLEEKLEELETKAPTVIIREVEKEREQIEEEVYSLDSLGVAAGLNEALEGFWRELDS